MGADTSFGELPKQKDSSVSSKREPAAKRKKKRRRVRNSASGKKLDCGGPSIFYKPTIELKTVCEPEEKLETFQVRVNHKFQEQSACEKGVKALVMEGAAWILNPETQERVLYNIINDVKPYNFHQMTKREINRCPYAYGMVDKDKKPICLDAFYSVAADPAFHQPGDVFFFPELVGMKIPKEFQSEGRVRHDGYMIMRDKGNLIKGEHRFDFYSGPMFWADRKNPFFRKGLYDKTRCIGYEKIVGEKADEVRARHKFPNIPTSVLPAVAPPQPPEDVLEVKPASKMPEEGEIEETEEDEEEVPKVDENTPRY